MATSLLARSWTYLLVRGLVGVVFGIVAMAAPLSTVAALALLWGFWALFDGVSTLAQAFKAKAPPVRWVLVLTGVLSLVVAFLAIFSPSMTAVALTWALGIWLAGRGALEGVLALVDSRGSARWSMFASAMLDVLLGTLVMSNPGKSAVAIAFVLGLTALVWGLCLCALAWWVRRAGSRPATTYQQGAAAA
jgi:uncharacterized membrane protein HdeD (DUF308 family)